MQFLVKIWSKLTGDKINLPSNTLNDILNQYGVDKGGSLPHPLTFEIRRGGLGSELKSYGRVIEFTADENTIEISPFIANALDITDSDQSSSVTVTDISLPKATLAVLNPLTTNYLQIPDMRSLLTSFLRKHHAILIEGSTLKVDFGRYQTVAFQIKKLQPESVCLCLDTDLEIDIAADNLEFAESAILLKNQAENSNFSIKNWKQRESEWVFDIKPQTLPATIRIPLMDEKVEIYEIKVILEIGDMNIFGSDATETPSMIDHTFYSVEKGSRSFLLDANEFSRHERPFIFLYLESCENTPLKYRLQVIAKKSVLSDIVEETQFISDEKMEKCGNCLLFVPGRTMQMHSAFCLRNNILCEKCRKVFQKNTFSSHWHCDQCSLSGNIDQMAKHNEMMHHQRICSCGESLYLAQVKHHKRDECPDRFIICRYCHLLVVAGKPSRLAKDLYLDLKLSEHESECGARTIDCQKCQKSVQLKEIQLHAQTHEIQKQRQPLPFQLCQNILCPNPQNVHFLNALKLCQTCFGPFYSPRYDPLNQKIPQKIVQTYHHQLTVGCKTNYCSNPYCCTSSDQSICVDGPLNANDAALLAIEMLQKSSAMNPNKPNLLYSFCLKDQALATRSNMANRLLQEAGKIYQKEWCIKALLENKDDFERALSWLKSNAPSLS